MPENLVTLLDWTSDRACTSHEFHPNLLWPFYCPLIYIFCLSFHYFSIIIAPHSSNLGASGNYALPLGASQASSQSTKKCTHCFSWNFFSEQPLDLRTAGFGSSLTSVDLSGVISKWAGWGPRSFSQSPPWAQLGTQSMEQNEYGTEWPSNAVMENLAHCHDHQPTKETGPLSDLTSFALFPLLWSLTHYLNDTAVQNKK